MKTCSLSNIYCLESELTMQHLPEFPPLPDCFSHLVICTDGEPRSFRSLSSHLSLNESVVPSFSIFSGRPEGPAKVDSFDEFDHYIMNGTGNVLSRLSVQGHENLNSDEVSKTSSSKASTQPSSPVQENDAQDAGEQKNPFLKLQTSLLKLQREMKDLRYMDISLFCQLLSLHEAVQDFKMTIAERYSETGSEYSLGTASYMGSMSSLNDDSDWGEEGTLLISSHDRQDSSEHGENTDENSHSASDLLKQITDLVKQADYDF